jgi:NAD(P)-dependent dehydrogenase (short-subunit alcohol dehydrogenase family)
VIARRLARDGLAVAVNGRRGDGPAREVAGSVRAGGGIAEAFGADVTDEAQVAELIAAPASRPTLSMLTWHRCPPGGWEPRPTSPTP